MPEEYEKCLVGLNAITREASATSQQTEDRREKIQALSLAKECYSMKLDSLTNATVVDGAIRFVSSKQEQQHIEEGQDNSSNSSNNNHIQGSKEENQQCGTVAAAAITTSQTFLIFPNKHGVGNCKIDLSKFVS